MQKTKTIPLTIISLIFSGIITHASPYKVLGGFDLQTNSIINLANGTNALDAVNLAQLQAADTVVSNALSAVDDSKVNTNHTGNVTINGSFAMGTGVAASGLQSTALGAYTTASGAQSLSWGSASRSVGNYSMAGGVDCITSNATCVALGSKAIAINNNSFIWGSETTNVYTTANKQFSVFSSGGIRLLNAPTTIENATAATHALNRQTADARYLKSTNAVDTTFGTTNGSLHVLGDAGITLKVGGAIQMEISSGEVSISNELLTENDPTSDYGVGNRGFNDARYLYTEGTQNYTNINSALSFEDKNFAIFYDDGRVVYTNGGAGDYSGVTGKADPILQESDCTIYQLRDITKSSEFHIRGTNFTYNGLGNTIYAEISGTNYTGNVGFRGERCDNVSFENVNLLFTIDSISPKYTNLLYNPYLIYMGSSYDGVYYLASNYVFRSCNFQLNYMLDAPTDPDGDFIKLITDVNLVGNAAFYDCTFIALCPNSTNELVNYTATHGASGALILENCRFITTKNLSKLLVNDGSTGNTYISDCYGNMQYVYANNQNDEFYGMTDERAKSYLFPGTEQYWTDGESDRPYDPPVFEGNVEDFQWHSVSAWLGLSSATYSAPFGFAQGTLAAVNNSALTGMVCIDKGSTSHAVAEVIIEVPASVNTNAAVFKFTPSLRLGFLSGGYPQARSFGTGVATSVTNSTGAALLTNLTLTCTTADKDISSFTFLRSYSSESNTTGTVVKVWGAKMRTY